MSKASGSSVVSFVSFYSSLISTLLTKVSIEPMVWSLSRVYRSLILVDVVPPLSNFSGLSVVCWSNFSWYGFPYLPLTFLTVRLEPIIEGTFSCFLGILLKRFWISKNYSGLWISNWSWPLSCPTFWCNLRISRSILPWLLEDLAEWIGPIPYSMAALKKVLSW